MKPVDKLWFWKERILNAQKERYSVYICSDVMWGKINTDHKRIINEIIPKGAKVLDAGCGYGRMSVYFDNYLGVDFSPDFIEKAKKDYPNKEFMVADLKSLPFKDAEFDWVVCVSIKAMIHNNLGGGEWNKMEDELKRVGKRILVLEYEESEKFETI